MRMTWSGQAEIRRCQIPQKAGDCEGVMPEGAKGEKRRKHSAQALGEGSNRQEEGQGLRLQQGGWCETAKREPKGQDGGRELLLHHLDVVLEEATEDVLVGL